jgi:hypothetical protein
MATTRKPTARKADAVRAKASAPRPHYVEPKRPLLSRRWLLATIAAVVGLVLVASFLAVWQKERRRSQRAAFTAKIEKAAQTFKTEMDAALAGAGSAGSSGIFAIQPGVPSAATGLGSGSVKAKQAIQTATAAQAALKTAESDVSKINVDKILGGKGFSESFVNYGFNAQEKISTALQIYQQMAADLEQAAKSSGSERAYLLAQIATLGKTAQGLFGSGYQQDYVALQVKGHVYAPPAGLGGLPGGAPGSTGGFNVPPASP